MPENGMCSHATALGAHPGQTNNGDQRRMSHVRGMLQDSSHFAPQILVKSTPLHGQCSYGHSIVIIPPLPISLIHSREPLSSEVHRQDLRPQRSTGIIMVYI